MKGRRSCCPCRNPRRALELNRIHTHSLNNKKKLARERTKTTRAETSKGGCYRKEVSQTGSRSQKCSSSLSLSLGLCLASQWGGTSFLYTLQLRLSVNPSTPPPCWHRQGEEEKMGWWWWWWGDRGSHTKQKLPLLRKRHQILCTFLHPTHTHSSFSPPLCPVPLTALDIREGWDVRERIRIQTSMTVTKTEKEC